MAQRYFLSDFYLIRFYLQVIPYDAPFLFLRKASSKKKIDLTDGISNKFVTLTDFSLTKFRTTWNFFFEKFLAKRNWWNGICNKFITLPDVLVPLESTKQKRKFSFTKIGITFIVSSVSGISLDSSNYYRIFLMYFPQLFNLWPNKKIAPTDRFSCQFFPYFRFYLQEIEGNLILTCN